MKNEMPGKHIVPLMFYEKDKLAEIDEKIRQLKYELNFYESQRRFLSEKLNNFRLGWYKNRKQKYDTRNITHQ